MKIEQKLQIDAIKGERIYYKVFDDVVLLTDGYTGCYYKKDQLKIDLSKLYKMGESENLNPKLIIKDENTSKAKETRVARLIGRSDIAIKLKSSDNYTFVNAKYLKMFFGYSGVRISKEKKQPILILKHGNPYGLIMPVNMGGFEVDESEKNEV